MLETLPRLRNSVAAWVTWIESMSCPFIKWADSNGRNSNSATRSTTFSLQLAERLNKLASGFGLRGSMFTDHEIPIPIISVSWLGSSFFEGNRSFIVNSISDLIRHYPWAFASGLLLLSAMLFSVAATVVILMPVGLALGLHPSLLIAFYPAANSVFVLPTYG